MKLIYTIYWAGYIESLWSIGTGFPSVSIIYVMSGRHSS